MLLCCTAAVDLALFHNPHRRASVQHQWSLGGNEASAKCGKQEELSAERNRLRFAFCSPTIPGEEPEYKNSTRGEKLWQSAMAC